MGSGAFCCTRTKEISMSIFLTIYLIYLLYRFISKNV